MISRNPNPEIIESGAPEYTSVFYSFYNYVLPNRDKPLVSKNNNVHAW